MSTREKLLLILLGAVVLAAKTGALKRIPETLKTVKKMLTPLGIRNNNPGNIRFNVANNWIGQTGEESGYAKFSDVAHGVRAAGKLLRNYQDRYGLDTISALIQRWAPQSENPTAEYIANIARWMGARADLPINLGHDAALESMLAGIFRQENGTQPNGHDWISGEEIRKGVALI